MGFNTRVGLPTDDFISDWANSLAGFKKTLPEGDPLKKTLDATLEPIKEKEKIKEKTEELIDNNEYNRSEEEETTEIQVDDSVITHDVLGNFIADAHAGSLIAFISKEGSSTFELIAPNQTVENAVIIGRISDIVDDSTSQYFLQGVSEPFEQDGVKFASVSFDGLTFTITDTDAEKGTCFLSWTDGKLTLAPTSPTGEEITNENGEEQVEQTDALPVEAEATTETPEEEVSKEPIEPEATLGVETGSKTETTPVSEEVSNTETEAEKDIKPDLLKDISVSAELFDEPIQWQFWDYFEAFMSACYKLAIAAEVTESPMTEAYMALCDELCVMLKQCIISENSEDTEDGDGTADDLSGEMTGEDQVEFKKALMVKLASSFVSKAGSRHNRQDTETLNAIHGLLVKLDNSVCNPPSGTETVETDEGRDASDLAQLSADAKSKLEELKKQEEELLAKVTQLDSDIATKTEKVTELETRAESAETRYAEALSKKLPNATKVRPDVEVDRLMSAHKQSGRYKSVLDMTNREILEQRDRRY